MKAIIQDTTFRELFNREDPLYASAAEQMARSIAVSRKGFTLDEMFWIVESGRSRCFVIEGEGRAVGVLVSQVQRLPSRTSCYVQQLAAESIRYLVRHWDEFLDTARADGATVVNGLCEPDRVDMFNKFMGTKTLMHYVEIDL